MAIGSRSSAATLTLARAERGTAPSLPRLHAMTVRALDHVSDLGVVYEGDPLDLDAAALTATVERAAERVAEAIATASTAGPVDRHVAVLMELRDLRGDLAQRRLASRLEALAGVHGGVDVLREAGSPAELLAKAPATLCTQCSFARCVISRVSGSEWIVENAAFTHEPDQVDPYLIKTHDLRAGLEHPSAEREVVRRRSSRRVTPETHPAPDLLPAGMTSYVVAPLSTRDRVFGLLHADHGPDDRPVDRLDELTLAAFADGVSDLYEHALLVRRLATQHEHVRRMVTSTGVLLDDLAMADIALAPGGEGDKHAIDGMTTTFATPETRVASLLTRRELEVLELMALGAGNSAIAEKLVIAEGTAKSHVKHILRKLRASNRAEAIARYLNGPQDEVTS